MKKISLFKSLFIFTFIFISASLITLLSGFNLNQENFKVSFEVKPANQSFICNFKISDINTGEILSNPTIICNNGQKSTISAVTSKGLSIHADVLVMSEINSMDYSIALIKNGKEVYKQNTSINLN